MIQAKGLRGDRVKALRGDMTQDDLGTKIGTTGKQVIRLEKPFNNCKAEFIIGLADALNTSADYLLGLTENSDPKLCADDLTDEERSLIIALRNRRAPQAINSFAVITQGWEEA